MQCGCTAFAFSRLTRATSSEALEQLFPPRGFGCEIDLHGKYLFI